METVYDHCEVSEEGHHIGSLKKRDVILTGSLEFEVLNNPNLDLFVNTLFELCSRHYNALNFNKFQEPTRKPPPADAKIRAPSNVIKELGLEPRFNRPPRKKAIVPRGQEDIESQVLKTHDALLELFRSAPQWVTDPANDEIWWQDKREHDAFRNMYAQSRGAQSTLYSGSSLTTSNTQVNASTSANTTAGKSTSKGKKRLMSSEDSGDAEVPSIKKSRKSHGPSLLAGPSSVSDGVFMVPNSEDHLE